MIEINKVSKLERVIDKIGSELPKPLAILVCGLDSELTTQVKHQITTNIKNLTHLDSAAATDTAKLREIFRRKENLLLQIPPAERHKIDTIVRRLRNAKARCIIGVYIEPLAERFADDLEKLKLWHQLNINPPRAYEFDYFAPVTEDAIRVLWCGTSLRESMCAFEIARELDGISITDCICPDAQSLHQLLELKDAHGTCVRQYPLNHDPHHLAKLIQDVDVIVGSANISDFLNDSTLAVYTGKSFLNRYYSIPDHLECFIRDAITQIPVFYDADYDLDTAHNPAAGQQILKIAKFMAKQPLRNTPYNFQDFYDFYC